ncbi:uncharacterized protein EHS24_004422 [Apiotrichum porosum]|uniref:SsDNA-binding protein, mitochondrial n=1 Tax=Apiotrichum porosum TaxID=105984 RepID=A0A427Y532_9TREE|nr:uncharacterized protein EHS24_004422 [Apiotrichum porosum]RSH86191.1 hypothetical protein EHS24_004422 [Apiotrichum porosum]
MFAAARSSIAKQSIRSFSTSRAVSQDMSRLTLIGRLGGDPVQRETTTGKPYYTYAVATMVGPGTQDEQGNHLPPPTSWHTVFAFSETSHKILGKIGKGSTVYVEAELEMRSGGAAADGSPLPDRPLLRHRTINVINRVRPQSDEVVDVETEEQKD